MNSPNHIATLPTMYQEIGPMGSTNSFPEFINTATTNAQTHQEMTILESILPHSNGEYQNFIPSTISSSPMSYHNNLPISYDPTTNQSDPLQRSSQYYSTQCTGWGNESHRFKQENQEQEAMNPTHISDSTKDYEETITSKKSTQKLITPSPTGYSRLTPKLPRDPCFDKSSQTTLSFHNKQDTIESTRYSEIHRALLQLESMSKPERKTKTITRYILRKQKDRQLVLQDMNINIAEINKSESQLYYTINCARPYTVRGNTTNPN